MKTRMIFSCLLLCCAVALTIASAQAQNGAVVTWDGVVTTAFFSNPETGLEIAAGSDPLMALGFLGCLAEPIPPGYEFLEIPGHDVLTPSGNSLTSRTGPLYTLVRPIGGNCDSIIAAGWADSSYTINKKGTRFTLGGSIDDLVGTCGDTIDVNFVYKYSFDTFEIVFAHGPRLECTEE